MIFKKIPLASLLLASLLLSPSIFGRSIPPTERDAVRAEIDHRAADIVQAMSERHEGLEEVLDSAEGFFAGRISSATVVAVGGGTGIGVIVDAADESRTYMNVRRVDLGAGLGAGRYWFLVIFHDRASLEKFRQGTWQSTTGLQTVVGGQGRSTAAVPQSGVSAFAIAESGTEVSATIRLIRLSINRDLTDTGVSSVSIPQTGFRQAGQQEENAPRTWDHRLPFLAQKVIDEGYDLPLPYGTGINYAYVEQDQLLDSLEVGLNGGDIVPYEFVSFENAVSKSDSAQAKIDAWLFPFLNVYAMVGKVDGDAPLDVLLDGNGILDFLDQDCSGIIKPPACLLLTDRVITLPIEATFSGTTYGIGAVLAGGWKNWFVTIPMNWTYADMDTTETDGVVWTLTPRGGYLFDLGSYGALALMAGGNYLESDLKIRGQVVLADELVVDYRIRQSNKDPWNVVLGFNWDFNRRWSWQLEYNGFTGSREAFITSVNFRW